MSKRFTATEKWLDPWFCNLSIVDRLFWIYLCDNCDHAGIWQVNLLLIKTYFPGYNPTTETFGDRLRVLTSEKWLLTKFVEFQYGRLNPVNRVHQSVIDKLQKEGASIGAYKGLTSPIVGAKDKDKDIDVVVGVEVPETSKVKEKKQVKEIKAKELNDQEYWFSIVWDVYPQKGRIRKKESFRRFCASVKDLETAKRCGVAVDKYRECKKVQEGYVQNASTWFGDWESWEHYVEETNGALSR